MELRFKELGQDARYVLSKFYLMLAGRAVHLSVGRDGTCWCVNGNDEIYRWTGAGWALVDGKLMNISVYNANTVIGCNRSGEIWRWTENGWVSKICVLHS